MKPLLILAISSMQAATFSHAQTGRVGIGVTTPAARLDVVGDTVGFRLPAAWDNLWFTIQATTANINASGAEAGLNFRVGNANTGTYGAGQTLTDVMTLRHTGNVGIGTPIPAEKLDVAGSVRALGQYTYAAPQTHYLVLGPGDFFVVDPSVYDKRIFISGGGHAYRIFMTGSGAGTMFAPVRLPDGAVVTNLSFRVTDDDGLSANPTQVRLTWRAASVGTANTIFGSETPYLTLPSDFPNIQEASMAVSGVTINNSSGNVYELRYNAERNPNVGLYSVTIAYTVSKAD